MDGAFGAPELGLAGAGAGTLLVAVVAAASTVGYLALAPSNRIFGLADSFGRISPADIACQLRLGGLIGLSVVAETGAFMASTLAVGAIAADALPAHTVAIRLLGVGYCVLLGFGQALTAYLAMARGAGDHGAEAEAVRVAISFSCVAATLFLAVFVGGAVVFGPVAPPEVGALSLLTGLVLAAVAFNTTALALLRGRADATVPAVLVCTGFWLVAPGVAAACTGHLPGEVAIWVGLATGATVSALATWSHALSSFNIACRPSVPDASV
jgi:MATE family multidrug resistance protein